MPNTTIKGGALALRRDLNASAPLTVVTPLEITQVTWNGERVSVREDGALLTGYFVRSASVQGVTAPTLTGWRFRNSLLEIRNGFDPDGREQDDYESRSEATVWRREGAVRYVYCIGGCHARGRS